MAIKKIETSDAPNAVGPYSQAVVGNGMVFTSGQLAIDPNTQKLISGGIKEQTHRVCKNIKSLLDASDSSLENVVKTTIFLRSMADFKIVNEIYSEYFKSKPARSTVPTDSFPEDIKIEIDCIALVNTNKQAVR